MSAKERFWSHVDKAGPCWIWLASRYPDGYGQFWADGRKWATHRLAYTWSVGRIPDGMVLDHRCHVRACVNPDHLRLVTKKENAEHRRRRNGEHWRGTSFYKALGKWMAYATHNGRMHHAGYYSTAEEAAEAARQLRLSLFTHNDLDRNEA